MLIKLRKGMFYGAGSYFAAQGWKLGWGRFGIGISKSKVQEALDKNEIIRVETNGRAYEINPKVAVEFGFKKKQGYTVVLVIPVSRFIEKENA